MVAVLLWSQCLGLCNNLLWLDQSFLTHCSQVMPYGNIYIYIYISVNFGSDNDLLPDGTKPLPEPMLTYHQGCSVDSPESNFTFHTQKNCFNLICSIYSAISCYLLGHQAITWTFLRKCIWHLKKMIILKYLKRYFRLAVESVDGQLM